MNDDREYEAAMAELERARLERAAAAPGGLDSPEPLRGGVAPGFTPRKTRFERLGEAAAVALVVMAVIGMITVLTVLGSLFHAIWRQITG